jgi:hypothetical protein
MPSDTLILAYRFGEAVAAALNASGVEPPVDNDDGLCAVMTIVATSTTVPVGGSINFKRATKRWEYEAQVQQGEMAS